MSWNLLEAAVHRVHQHEVVQGAWMSTDKRVRRNRVQSTGLLKGVLFGIWNVYMHTNSSSMEQLRWQVIHIDRHRHLYKYHCYLTHLPPLSSLPSHPFHSPPLPLSSPPLPSTPLPSPHSFYGPEMDLWGAGCVLFEITALYPLFPGNDEVDQVQPLNWICMLSAVTATVPDSEICTIEFYVSYLYFIFLFYVCILYSLSTSK